MRGLRLLAVSMVVAAIALAQPEPSSTGTVPDLADLTGVWKMAYSPGLRDVDEIDDAYLVIRPDKTYTMIFRMRPGTGFWFEEGIFTLEPGSIFLEQRPAEGTLQYPRPAAQRLFVLPPAPVVFFDNLLCQVETSILSGLAEPPDLHYTWGLAFGGTYGKQPMPERTPYCGFDAPAVPGEPATVPVLPPNQAGAAGATRRFVPGSAAEPQVR